MESTSASHTLRHRYEMNGSAVPRNLLYKMSMPYI